MKFSLKEAHKFAKFMKLNMEEELFTLFDLMKGMNVELEHGKISKETNVTNDDLIKTGKIALAHLREAPDYYKRLDKLEKSAEKYWKNKPKKRMSKKIKGTRRLTYYRYKKSM